MEISNTKFTIVFTSEEGGREKKLEERHCTGGFIYMLEVLFHKLSGG